MTDRPLPAAAGEPIGPAFGDVDGSLPVTDIVDAVGGDGGSSADAGYEPPVPPDEATHSDEPTHFASMRTAEVATPRAHDAMRVLSRMQIDLDLVTEGKRAATYGEVDTAFDDAVKALGIKLPDQSGGPAPVAPGTVRSAWVGVSPVRNEAGGDMENPGAISVPGLDAISSRLPNSTSPANMAPPAGPTVKKKGAKGRGAVATPWPTLPDQRVAPAARDWPIPGDHHFAVAGAKGPNKLTYSDGRYAPEGGYRGIDAKTKKLRKHKGIDIPATAKDPVSAAADGVILQSAWQKDWGNFVAVRHPDGYVTLYAHLDTRAKLKAGQVVARGAEIGTVGNSGNAKAKGTHLHFEVRVYNGDSTLAAGGRTVDPEAWIRGDLHETTP